MELFFNLVWGGLSLMLGYLWLTGLRKTRNRKLMPGVAIQLVALCMLILVLLPVVSLTDDLTAMATPAETEHLTRRADIWHPIDQPADFASLFPFPPSLSFSIPPPQTFALREASVQEARPHTGYIQRMANRPPPIWA